MHAVHSGHLVLLMAPSGSGKSVLLSHLRAEMPSLHFAVSCTTRAMRPGEKEGEIYHFVDQATFDEYKQNGLFLEWAEYSNSSYGTLKTEIIDTMNEGKVVVREVELQGVQSILKLIPRERITIIYINGGSWEALKERITARAPISDAELLLRYERFVHETEAKELADIEIYNGEGELEAAKERIVEEVKKLMPKANA